MFLQLSPLLLNVKIVAEHPDLSAFAPFINFDTCVSGPSSIQQKIFSCIKVHCFQYCSQSHQVSKFCVNSNENLLLK